MTTPGIHLPPLCLAMPSVPARLKHTEMLGVTTRKELQEILTAQESIPP